jgi:microcystin degradation protein MlrC
MVVVKSPQAFRAAYSEFMADAISVDGPGPSTGRVRSLEAQLNRVTRPIYPFDEMSDEAALSIARSGWPIRPRSEIDAD